MAVIHRPTIIIAVGDELLDGFTADTNSFWLAGRVRNVGYPALRIEVVPDDCATIIEVVQQAIHSPATRILVCGGIGPTPDDQTLGAVAEALGRPLEANAEVLDHVQSAVSSAYKSGRTPSPEVSAAKRRLAPAAAVVMRNPRGVAAGLGYHLNPSSESGRTTGGPEERWLVVMPGVPAELRAITDEQVLPRLFRDGRPLHVLELVCTGIPESQLAQPMTTVSTEYPGVHLGSYPHPPERRTIIRFQGADATELANASRRFRELSPAGGEYS